HGILADAYTFELGPVVYPPRTFCVQYAETDLHFIQRLCEEEGIHYHFRHSADAHVLVLGDDQTVFRRLPAQRYCPAGGPAAETLVIQRFDVRL
ncbi:contractile injection system protein, VgrG/Pvc8 family, partial [Klebsiella pneumoniae]|uniref:contractile injection system protein, VgrG/Pvc8 family n=2 Tax=Gammaproteobacteria TaxID=1236 RepID=UPI002F96B6B2